LFVLSRSEIVDERVYQAAEVAITVLPRGPMWRPVPWPNGVIYPVIERQSLNGWTDASGAPVPPLEIWWRETTINLRPVGMFLLLLLPAIAFGFVANQLSWPRVNVGRRIALGRLAKYALAVGVWTAPIAALCMFLFWPMVSFWGSFRMISIELFSTPYWIVDSTLNRVTIGAGLLLCYLLGCLFVARRRLNTLIVSGEFAGIDDGPRVGACLECGYCAHLPLDLCPECGSPLQTHRRVLFIWPRFLGTPTRIKRRRIRFALAALIACLLVAPLWMGVLRVVLGSL